MGSYLRSDLEDEHTSIGTKSGKLFAVHAFKHCDDGGRVQIVLDVFLAVLVRRRPVVHPQRACARACEEKSA